MLEVIILVFQQLEQTSVYSQHHNKTHWNLKGEPYDGGAGTGASWLVEEDSLISMRCPLLAFDSYKKITRYNQSQKIYIKCLWLW